MKNISPKLLIIGLIPVFALTACSGGTVGGGAVTPPPPVTGNQMIPVAISSCTEMVQAWVGCFPDRADEFEEILRVCETRQIFSDLPPLTPEAMQTLFDCHEGLRCEDIDIYGERGLECFSVHRTDRNACATCNTRNFDGCGFPEGNERAVCLITCNFNSNWNELLEDPCLGMGAEPTPEAPPTPDDDADSVPYIRITSGPEGVMNKEAFMRGTAVFGVQYDRVNLPSSLCRLMSGLFEYDERSCNYWGANSPLTVNLRQTAYTMSRNELLDKTFSFSINSAGREVNSNVWSWEIDTITTSPNFYNRNFLDNICQISISPCNDREINNGDTIYQQNNRFCFCSPPDEDAIVTQECRLDGELLERCESPLDVYTAEDGEHHLEVRTIDVDGNVGIAEKQWTLDRRAPAIEIYHRPPEIIYDGRSSCEVSFGVQATPAMGATVTCEVNGEPSPFSGLSNNYSRCSGHSACLIQSDHGINLTCGSVTRASGDGRYSIRIATVTQEGRTEIPAIECLIDSSPFTITESVPQLVPTDVAVETATNISVTAPLLTVTFSKLAELSRLEQYIGLVTSTVEDGVSHAVEIERTITNETIDCNGRPCTKVTIIPTRDLEFGGIHSFSVSGSMHARGVETQTLGRTVRALFMTTPGMIDVAASFAHSLAIRSDGSLWCWGSNSSGACGGSLEVSRYNSPHRVKDINNHYFTNVVDIATGWQSSYAVKVDGSLWSVGYNQFGQLGLGHTISRNAAQQVQFVVSDGGSAIRIKKVAAGAHHVLALDQNHRVWSWGKNYNNSLGRETALSYDTRPSLVNIVDANGERVGMVDIIAGKFFSMARDVNGHVWSWGDNTFHQLGHSGTMPSRVLSSPTDTTSYLENIVAIAAGDGFSFALDNTGHIWSWGRNASTNVNLLQGTITHTTLGTLGRTITGVRTVIPGKIVDVTGAEISGFTKIAAGRDFGAALKNDGTIWAWGKNTRGVLGLPNEEFVRSYADTFTLSDEAIDVTAGEHYILIRTRNGEIQGWGNGASCQLGTEVCANTTTPVTVNTP